MGGVGGCPGGGVGGIGGCAADVVVVGTENHFVDEFRLLNI